MILFLLAYLGGALTIVSPCILPVLPFVFARADRPFVRSGLPLLLGMAVTFAAVATLAVVGGGWIVEANNYGRMAALAILGLFGLLLLFPSLADRATRPLVALGSRLSNDARHSGSFASSLLLGIATGLLWAPCAGPVLGLLLTGAALNGASPQTSLLLLAYALGAASSLALALLVGGRVFAAMKRSIRAGEWLRKGLGAAVLAGVVAIGFGLDTGLLTRLSLASTARFEQGLLDRLHPEGAMPKDMPGADALADKGVFPSLAGATGWMNSPPLTTESLRGKVVLIDFWTYSCINCLRTIPYVKTWQQKYRDKGLVVIGVHTPEFAFERDPDNVAKAIKDLGITYPVALDNRYAIWRGFDNKYWPAHYFIDAMGRIRAARFGEGHHEESEKIIQRLIAENGGALGTMDTALVDPSGVGEGESTRKDRSPETYVGYARAANFVSPGGFIRDAVHDYAIPALTKRNDWALGGQWVMGGEHGVSAAREARIAFRFRGRDLHLVLGTADAKKPVRFRVTLDGKAPGIDHGLDIDAQGNGTVTEQRLYQLVRQQGPQDRTFQIEFLEPGVQAFAFTFG